MERVMSPEERIRRAEEIYYRRQNQGVRVSTNTAVNVRKASKVSLGKKMGMQIFICVLIYSFFCIIKNNNTIFSQNVINTTKTFLSYDINLPKMYKDGMEYFNKNFNNIISASFFYKEQYENNQEQSNENVDITNNGNNVEKSNESVMENNIKNVESKAIENTVDTQNETENMEKTQNEANKIIDSTNNTQNIEKNTSTETTENQAIQNTDITNLENETPGIGGGSDVSINNNTQNKSQMELDAEYIKQNCSLIIPVQGYVTSGFGNREPTEIISAFHQGIDIGAVTGTIINASMEGKVVAASYAGDYGNHIKIQNGDVLTVYAHCSELNVCVGDYVYQGQQIGKVGSTGKVTGPHLHFEIRKENRYVDPSLILNF